MQTRTALISVYNKDGIAPFVQSLVDLGFEILSSGGTAKVLQEAGITVTDVASLVGEPILGHRVVTLSREIHAGLLARDNEEDRAELKKLNTPFIDLVCCDLYPLKEEISKTGATLDSVIEKTDIGGPTMLRSAAKGGRIVIADVNDRQKVIDYLKQGNHDEGFVRRLAAKAEFIIAEYCMHSANYLSGKYYTAVLCDHYPNDHHTTPSRTIVIN